MKKPCLECGDEFVGRADKRFCSDQCRSAHNNKRNNDSSKLIKNINNTLRKNRRILEELNPEGKTTVHKSKLDLKGFSLQYYTHIYTTKTGNTYVFCYDYGYRLLDNDFYLLVKNDKE